MASSITPEQALENTRRLLEQRAGMSRTPTNLQDPRDARAHEAEANSGNGHAQGVDPSDPGWPPLARDDLSGRRGGRHH